MKNKQDNSKFESGGTPNYQFNYPAIKIEMKIKLCPFSRQAIFKNLL